MAVLLLEVHAGHKAGKVGGGSGRLPPSLKSANFWVRIKASASNSHIKNDTLQGENLCRCTALSSIISLVFPETL